MTLPAYLLGEPAWDMLLDLLVLQAEGRDVPLKDACIASGVPSPTAKRYLDALTARGMIDQGADPHDRMRKLLVLRARVKQASGLQSRIRSKIHSDRRVRRDP